MRVEVHHEPLHPRTVILLAIGDRPRPLLLETPVLISQPIGKIRIRHHPLAIDVPKTVNECRVVELIVRVERIADIDV